jgi:hypothetical protein
MEKIFGKCKGRISILQVSEYCLFTLFINAFKSGKKHKSQNPELLTYRGKPIENKPFNIYT